MTPEENRIIKDLEALKGRKLTQQEINLALDQARAIGDLPQVDGQGSGYRQTK